ncbi:MAG TPA: thioredoxin family protein, partial [Polyangiaceae bacterium]|nr:thioredoxin family protein [Polyangiaceae bacterium]
IYVFDAQGRLAYRGQFDESRPGNGVAVTGADERAAVDALLASRRPSAEQKPSIGCNIKWKAGKTPV